jgi:hypothetical protein
MAHLGDILTPVQLAHLRILAGGARAEVALVGGRPTWTWAGTGKVKRPCEMAAVLHLQHRGWACVVRYEGGTVTKTRTRGGVATSVMAYRITTLGQQALNILETQ